MFDLGATELLVIGIVAIIVVGPKELPKMLRAFGQFVAKMRGMAREFQSMFEEAARGSDVLRGGDVLPEDTLHLTSILQLAHVDGKAMYLVLGKHLRNDVIHIAA